MMTVPVLTVMAVGPIDLSLDLLGHGALWNGVSPLMFRWLRDGRRILPSSCAIRHNPGHFSFPAGLARGVAGTKSICGRLPSDAGLSGQRLLLEATFRRVASFLCSHPDFVVLDAPNAFTLDGGTNPSSDLNKPNWFDNNVRTKPEFEWTIIGSFDGPRVTEFDCRAQESRPAVLYGAVLRLPAPEAHAEPF